MKRLFKQLVNPRKKITFEDVEIFHETESAVLVELKDQSIWLSKRNITLTRQNGHATLTIPLSVLKKIFPSIKYRQFSDI